MNPFPPVIKLGSHWEGEVVDIDDLGNVVTNILVSEVKPLAKASTLWIEFVNTPVSIRGLSTRRVEENPGKLVALEGRQGTIEIIFSGGSAAAQAKLKVGDKISLYFRS